MIRQEVAKGSRKHSLETRGRSPVSASCDRTRFATQTEARIAIFDFIEGFYNPSRRHSSLGYLSPIEFERAYETDQRLLGRSSGPSWTLSQPWRLSSSFGGAVE